MWILAVALEFTSMLLGGVDADDHDDDAGSGHDFVSSAAFCLDAKYCFSDFYAFGGAFDRRGFHVAGGSFAARGIFSAGEGWRSFIISAFILVFWAS